MKFYYLIDNKQYGPNSVEDLAEPIRRRVLNASTLVFPEGGKMWKPLSQYAELKALLPAGSKSKPAPTSIKAVPAYFPTSTYSLDKLPTAAQAPTASAPQQPGPPTLRGTQTPLIAQILQIIAAVNLFLGLVVAILYMSESYPMSGIIGFSVLIGAALSSVFLYAFSLLLTWVYNIMLNTRRK